MPRRIEIELTSSRPDGTWTWRAAGAREPKGVLDGGLLHEGAKTGDVLRAEAEFELEGIVITSVAAPKADQRPQVQTIEIVGPGRPEGPGVTTQLVGRGERRERRPRDDDRRRERGPGRPDGRPRTEGGRPRREGGPRPDGPRGEGRPRGEDDASRGEGRGAARREAPAGESGRREGREGAGNRPARTEGARRPGTPGRTSSQAERGDRSKARRLNPGSAHRKTVLDSLPPEQQPIAEHLLRGGIPAVRTALHLEREKAEAEGRPAPNSEALLALAESLLPRLRAAEWRDRAEAAAASVDEISLRDLRTVVAGADAAGRDEESRKLLTTLREAVDARVDKLHTDWANDITAQLDAGRAVRAVRLSARPPDGAARLDAPLTNRLAEAASATMSPETRPDLWLSMLEAVAESPIRRQVTPAGLPADAPAELKRAAHQFSGSVPALAKLLGVAIPPPPIPVAARKRAGDRPAGGGPPRRGGPPARGARKDGDSVPATEQSRIGGDAAKAEQETGREAPAGEEHPASQPEEAATEASVEAAEAHVATEEAQAEAAPEAAASPESPATPEAPASPEAAVAPEVVAAPEPAAAPEAAPEAESAAAEANGVEAENPSPS